MRIVIADYSGHPFQVQLSRELARRGHSVLHLHFAEFQTPKGRLTAGPDDPGTLSIEAISLGRPFAKQSFLKRRYQEIEIGKRFSHRIASFVPDIVVGCNFPLDTLRVVSRNCSSIKSAFVFWQQDIYSIAIERILSEKFGPLGRLVGMHYRAIEHGVLKSSDAVIAISEDFRPYLTRDFQIDNGKLHVLENWAPLDEIYPQPKDNVWSRAMGLWDKDVVLYTGTLGMKHDPRLLLDVAVALRAKKNTVVVIASQGPAVDWLTENGKARGLKNLRIMGFQPFEVYSDVLASADVLVAILEAESGTFSVPSKVLSYLCAGRPIVLSAPEKNLASRIVKASGSGIAVPSGDSLRLSDSVLNLMMSSALREQAGTSGRAYAERTFDIQKIAGRFEAILESACDYHRKSSKELRGIVPSAA